MKVDKGRIIYDIIAKDKIQYSIPVYQRNYDWTKTQCEKLYYDIINCIDTRQLHFIGSIVNAQVNSHNKLFRYVIVDGQQRMTTIFLLLKALYDNSESELDKERITSWIFNVDKYNELELSDETKLKLKPIKSDNIQLTLLMNDKFDEMDKSSNIYRNYEYFKAKTQQSLNSGYTIRNICDGIEDLICAIITLEPTDKPQEVFESINSTGKPLTISDLIRNFVLMTDDNQDFLFENYWIKIEEKISKEKMTDFLIDYLNFKMDGFIREADAYDSFKKLYKNENFTNEIVLKELLHYATIYNYFLQGSSTLTFEVNEYLDGLKQIKQTTCYVFLFKVFDDYLNNVIDSKTLENVLRFLLNYSVRRLLYNVGSNSLRSLYKYLYSRLFSKEENKKFYFDTILSYFHQLTTKDALIKDNDLKESLIKNDLYHKNTICKYVLYKMENFGSKEIVDVKNLTIEHIMPQNEFLNKSWKEMLGADWNIIHSTYLHTLGNLTLTGYNSELSDKSFKDKKELLENTNTKLVVLNKDVRNSEIWNEKTILERAKRLGELLTNVFHIAEPQIKISFKDESYKTYTLDNTKEATGLKPKSYSLEGEVVMVDDFKEMMDSVLLKLYEREPQIIERIATNNEKFVGWSKKVFVSCDSSLFRFCEQIGDTGIYYDTNLSSPHKLSVIKYLLNEYGVDLEDFTYSAKPSKSNK